MGLPLTDNNRPMSPKDTHDRDYPLPLVGVSSCRRNPEGSFYVHWCSEKYVEAVARGARAMPMIVPAAALQGVPDDWIEELIPRLDGLMLTGSRTNVEPHHYGMDVFDGDEADPHRDATFLPLTRAAIEAGVPVLAICRGIQELNVALGGSLIQKVHEVPGRIDHRADRSKPLPGRFDMRHKISIRPDGPLAQFAGGEEATVNSLHGQAIDRLGDGLVVEATADDGTIEAVSMPGARAFTMGVQWHAEWDFEDIPLYTTLIAAFGDAIHHRAAGRRMGALQAAE